MKYQNNWSRRRFLQAAALGVSGLISPKFSYAGSEKFLTKPIPSSNEQIPMVGLGSSRFKNDMACMLQRRVEQGKAGRPVKKR